MPPTAGDSSAQPSIHSFFKRKTPPLSSPVETPSAARSVNGRSKTHDTAEDDEHDDAVVDITASPPPLKRPRTSDEASAAGKASRKSSLTQSSSSYFSKPAGDARHPLRDNSVLSESMIIDDQPIAGPSKPSPRSRTRQPSASAKSVLEGYRMRSIRPPSVTQSGSAFENYTVPSPERDAPLGDPPQQSSQTRSPAQQKRHDAWQRRVLGPSGLVPRRRSLALDEAAAAEARRAAGGADVDGEDAADTPAVEEAIVAGSDGESKKAAAMVGSKLAEKFAAKGSETHGTAKGRGKKKKEEEVGPSGQTYTPLERQFKEIKAGNPDVLLLMEVGYKYKFHGDDAKIAAKELGIAAFPSRNFYTASIPTHRLHIHVRKLISLGYKVGVISQMETAALKKVGENRNAPFTRELTHLYTAATYVEDPSGPSSSTATDEPIVSGSAPPPTNALVALVEQGMGGQANDERVRIGLVSVVPGTGDVVYDEFDDSPVRSELETRLTHLQPAELLLPAVGLSKATEKVLNHFAGRTKTSASSSVRVERVPMSPTYDSAFDYLTKFYKLKPVPRPTRPKINAGDSEEIDLTGMSEGEEEEVGTSDYASDLRGEVSSSTNAIGLAAGLPAEEAVLALVDFPKQIVIALTVIVKYMKNFGLENAFRHRSSFTKFINRAHMLLSSNTLLNLEIYRNQSDGSVYGSLLWLLDQSKTRMGRRLLREWIGRPLLDISALQARVDAIEEIIDSNTYHMEKLRSLRVNMPDLVKGLTRIQYGKATPSEIANILVALARIGSEFKPNEGDVFRSGLLNNIVNTLPTIREAAREFIEALNIKETRNNNEADLWTDADKYPDVQDAKDICDSELDQHLHEIRKVLKRPSLTYVTVAGIEYLVEVPVRDAKSAPPKWVKVQSTKNVVRFHTPDVLRITKEREQHKETLGAAAKSALLSFQSDISECHSLIVVSRQVAVIDCLMSLAQVAAANQFCKPVFTEEVGLHIRDGRHPMVEAVREDIAYVPFDIDFSEEDGAAKVITGPNMAGKSSCVRATALIVCMAQIGSFVPASSVMLGIHEAVQTRMGASDEIGRGKSTFMVELSETSDILRTITPRTLVILDELGRGTSTYDGVAIAYATLSHLARINCPVLFVTHYPMVAEELAKEYPRQVSNWHMSFDEKTLPDGSAEITFLYRLTRGLAEASFGVWCARLAGLPSSVLQNAQLRADHLRAETEQRLASAITRKSHQVLKDCHSPSTPVSPLIILRDVSALNNTLRLAMRG